MKRSHRRGALALALAIGASVSGSGPALADAQITEVGWWRSVAVSQPPPGGVAVGSNLSGPSAVAAFRVSVGDEAPLTAELTLMEAGNVAGEAAPLQICPTADEWTPAEGGTIDQAPTADCEAGSVVVARSSEGAWTADVASLLQGDTVSLMLVPGDTADSADPLAGAATYEVSFEPPTLTATAPVSSSASEEPSGSFEGSGEPVSSSAPSSSGSGFTAPAFGDERPPFDPIPVDRGEVGLAAPPPAAGDAPAAPPPGDQVAVGPSSPVPTRAVTDPGSGGGGREWAQAIRYTLMAAAIGAAAGAIRWQLRSRGMIPA